MSHHEHMHVLDARAASFDAVKPKGKKRTSNAKAKKSSFSWDFAVPSIEQVRVCSASYPDVANGCSSPKPASTILQPHNQKTMSPAFTVITR